MLVGSIAADALAATEALVEGYKAAASPVSEVELRLFDSGPISVRDYADRYGITDFAATLDLDAAHTESDNIERVKIDGTVLYRFRPISFAVQITPETVPADVPDAPIVVINHSETKVVVRLTGE